MRQEEGKKGKVYYYERWKDKEQKEGDELRRQKKS